MIGLAELLERIVWDGPFRASVLTDPHALDDDAREALTGLDPAALEAYAARARADVMRARHRGSGSLADLYAQTLAGHDPDAVAAGFCASPHFRAPRLSAEEAFVRYARDAGLGPAREVEFLVAMTKALAAQPHPDFDVPLPRRGRGWAAVHDGVLYAAVDGRTIRGPVTPELARALETGRHEQLAPEVVARLRALGLAPAEPSPDPGEAARPRASTPG